MERTKVEVKQKITPPVLIVNFKAYREATLENAVRLAEIADDIAHDYTDCTIAIAVNFIDLARVVERVSRVLVFAQHADPVEPGAHTGHVPPALLAGLGVAGTILNHSERKVPHDILAKAVELCKKYGLLTCVCAASLEECERLVALRPTMLAYEPPELIGTGRAVSKEKPEVLNRAMTLIRERAPGTLPLCGAGITTAEDVRKAVELGAVGVLVASAVVKAQNPASVLEDLTNALIEAIESAGVKA